MSKVKILVVDDEQGIVDLVTAYLEREDYEVHTVMDGLAALQDVQRFKPDLIVLDIMLPGLDGLEVLTQLRRYSEAYVIMLTAKSEETDKIVGLSMGADDYLTKPFSPRELVARVKAALRRFRTGAGANDTEILTYRHLRLDTGRRQVWVDEKLVSLTTVEFDLLKTLMAHPGLVLSREQLLESVWGQDFYGETRVVDVHIGHIRHKLGAGDLIETVRGVGYRFEDEEI